MRLSVVVTVLLASGCESTQQAIDSSVVFDQATPADDLTVDAVRDAGEVPPDDGGVDDESTADNPPIKPDVSMATGCVQGSFTAYFGNFHAHTGNSDGEGSPQEAFQYARDVAKLDIQVVTDHLEQLHFSGDRWSKCTTAAAAENQPGVFVAACGFEYGTAFTAEYDSAGHANVFFSATLFPAIQLDFLDFYDSLVACADCIGQFNHPGDEPEQHFNHFEYHADVDARINLFEFNSDEAWELYFEALDAGWHLSPMHNQDNHSADWGTADDRRSGVLLTDLSMPSLHDAMRERRTFMTYDKNATIKMTTSDGCWMGSILAANSATLSVEVSDADASDTFSAITLYGKAQQQLATFDCQNTNPCSASFSITAAQSPYATARAVQADGDLLVAAPIWLTP